MYHKYSRKSFFILIFALLGLAALQVKLTVLQGSKATFTLFDAFAPIAGSFLGSIPGVIAVFLMQLFNFFVHGAKVLDAGTLVRFIPALFATLYFAKKRTLNVVVPVLAIIAFNINPVGRSAWLISLYWLIPVACYFLYEKSIFARALGATFTAHAVGGAIWVWTFHLSKAVWLGLIPVVAVERLMFTVGIVISYVAVNNIVDALARKQIIKYQLTINPVYLLRNLKAN
jgi:hypothetical protein